MFHCSEELTVTVSHVNALFSLTSSPLLCLDPPSAACNKISQESKPIISWHLCERAIEMRACPLEWGEGEGRSGGETSVKD